MTIHQSTSTGLSQIDAVFALIPSQATIVTAMAAAEPQAFYSNLATYAPSFEHLQIYCANPSQPYGCFSQPGFDHNLKFKVMFLTDAVRPLLTTPRVDYVPQHLSRWAENLMSDKIDVFWGSCSMPDHRGFVSLGTNACYESEVLRKAQVVILEVNPQMPRTLGATTVSLDEVDHLLMNDHPLPTIPETPAEEIDHQIAAHVADLVPDRATLQLGIGSVPNAIAEALMSKKDLGIHTELINDAMMKLYQAGVVTGAHKTLWPHKIAGTFIYGSHELYRFVDQHPVFELHPASVINDPYRIGRNHKMISINSAIEIDLSGQVCSESIGAQEFSGVGGATDTHVGAQRSPGGRGIIALHSRSGRGAHSKIVPQLKLGARVSITRNDIDTVVTEYGIAELRGKSLDQRAQALIAIAHPEVRDDLLRSYHKMQ